MAGVHQGQGEILSEQMIDVAAYAEGDKTLRLAEHIEWAAENGALEAVAKAETIVRMDKEAAAAGRGSWALDGKMIDIPIVQRAEALLVRARAIAALEARKAG